MAIFGGVANQNAIDWKLLPWSDLTKEEWHAIVKSRIDVFVVEQTCPYPELDGKDRQSMHLFTLNLENEVAAYLRILPPKLSYAEWSIGRVLTTMPYRGQGIGTQLMTRAMNWLAENKGSPAVRISAQVEQIGWYGQWNFETVGEAYLEDDIPHIEMLRK